MRNLFAKRIPFASTALLLMAFMFACSHDEPEQPEKPAGPEVPEWEEVVIDGDGELSAMAFCIGGDSVNVENGTQSGNEESMRASTAFDGQNYVLTLGDRVTIELERGDGTKEGPKTYKVTNALTGALEFDDTGKPFYWENSSETVKLRAWSYGNSTAFSSEPVGNVFHLNANQQETTAGIDNYQELLYAPQWSCNYQDNKGKVEVKLYHQMARLTIRLKHEASENPSSTLSPLTIQQVTIGDGTLPNIAKFSETGIDIASNDFTGSWTDVKKETEATGVIKTRVDDAEDAKYSAVLFPGTFAAGTKFISILTTDGQTFAYKIPAGNTLTLEAGKQYDYTINVNDFVQVSTLDVSDIAAVTYTGSAQEPEPVVKYGEKVLTKDTHYTLSWSNNINAGTATCTVTGKGIFAGTATKNFTINPKPVTLTFADATKTVDYVWNISTVTNALTKSDNAATVTYTSSSTAVASVNSSNGALTPGGTANTTATITVTATGNYSGSATYTVKANSNTATFGYTGSAQDIALPKGSYTIECWGARGGSGLTHGSVSTTYGVNGGRGGYTKGTIALTASRTFYLYVGGAGTQGKVNTTVNGGWNGGGKGCPDGCDDEAAGGGGGATDVRTVSGAWNDVASLCSRIMVAGGGGGGSWEHLIGGCGGGTYGGFPYHKGGVYTTDDGKPSSPTSGYQFGTGQDGVRTVTNYDVGGGGGGYYGGITSRQGTPHSADAGSPGYGGSGFISGHTGCDAIKASVTSLSSIQHSGSANHYSSLKFTSTEMIDGEGRVWTSTTRPSTATKLSTITSNPGGNNGYARITFVSAN